ncbi:hypothetical protein [Rhizorhabdus wittichii]|uniref:hypothetical protein n=1 Tax=Rhizorhabdus wittichii TaxID=160791 RepID=UPI0012FD44B6|nr:hypothetical protein [Rhizorhabdus wittichii]
MSDRISLGRQALDMKLQGIPLIPVSGGETAILEAAVHKSELGPEILNCVKTRRNCMAQ